MKFPPNSTTRNLEVLMILELLHEISMLWHHASQGSGCLGSCRIFSLHRISAGERNS